MKKYQIFITNNSKSGEMKSFSFSSLHLKLLISFVIVFLLSLGIVTFDYSLAVSRKAKVHELRSENQELHRHLNAIKSRVHLLESSVQKVEDFSLKLKTITNKENVLSKKAIGPLPLYEEHSIYSDSDMWEDFDKALKRPVEEKSEQSKKKSFLEINKRFESKVKSLVQQSHTVQKDLWLAIGAIEEQKHLLSITPSILPVRGRITSRFGYRGSSLPYIVDTDASFHSIAHFHKGLDIAAPEGTHIQAPADGVVIMTGYDSMTGNYIYMSHGYDLNTLYGHLDTVAIESYDTVKRGQVIGTVGNTGRSTGAHLHYEVRISGQSVDPEYFTFDLL